MTIGEKIKNRRKEMGYTLEELANKLGVVRSAVFKWEKNECNPYRHIQKLAEILKVNPLYFTEWADNIEDKGGKNMKLNRKDIFKVFVGACDTYEPNDYAFIGTLDECNEYINKYNHQKQAYIEPAGEMTEKLKQTCPIAGYFVEFMVVASIIYGMYKIGVFIWNSVSPIF